MRPIVILFAALLSGCGENGAVVQRGSERSRAALVETGTPLPVLSGARANYSVILNGGSLTLTDQLSGASMVIQGARIQFNDTAVAYDISGIAGRAYRLYQAAFARVPDAAGLGFWIAQLDAGASMNDVAAAFVSSKEFADKYGANISDDAFITQLYRNVLNRDPDAGGYAFWRDAFKLGVTRHGMLVEFSESGENKSNVAAAIANGIAYVAPASVPLSTEMRTPSFKVGNGSQVTVAGSGLGHNSFGLNAFIDLDGDGRDDFVTTGAYYPPSPMPVVVYQGQTIFQRNGTWALDSGFPSAALKSVHAREFVQGDFNRDGVPDLFVADHGYDATPFPGFRNQLFLSQGGKATWIDNTSALPSISDFTHSATVGDVNGDGNQDIFAGNFAYSNTYLLIGDGKGGFTKATDLLPALPEYTNLTSSLLADLNGDGLSELVLGGSTERLTSFVLWNEKGSYASGKTSTLPAPAEWGKDWSVEDVQALDLNGDNKLDLVLAYQGHVWNGGWRIQFLVNEGDGTFTDATAHYLPVPKSVSSGLPTESNKITWIPFIRVRDLNGDGRPDLDVQCQSWGGKIAHDDCPMLLLRQADGRFNPITVGMLRAAGVPDYVFWDARLAATGTPGQFHIMQQFRASNGDASLGSFPISLVK